MYKQKIEILGYTIKDAEEKKSKNGKNYIVLRIAVNRREEKSGNEVTNFYNAMLFDKRIKVFSKAKKGQMMYVAGELKINPYISKKGEAKADLSILVDEIFAVNFF